MKTIKSIALVCAFFFCVGACAYAQDEEVYEGDYTYGIIVSASNEEIVLSEYDEETENEVERHYLITTETEFYNFEKVDELAQDDEVEVFYFEENDLRYAIYIAKE